MAAVHTMNPFFAKTVNNPFRAAHQQAHNNPLQKYKQLTNDLTVKAASVAVAMYEKDRSITCEFIEGDVEDTIKNYLNDENKDKVIQDVRTNIHSICNKGGPIPFLELKKKSQEMNDSIKDRLRPLYKAAKGGSRKSKNKRTRKTRRHRRSARHS